MSVVINYVSKYLALIATDTRITFGKDGEFGYDDDNEKLVDLPQMGWSAGAGLASFLDNFKSELGLEKVYDPRKIEEIFDEVYQRECNLYPDIKQHIEGTVVSASWVGMTEDDAFMRIGILSKKHFDQNMQLLQNGHFQLFYPSNYLDNLEMVTAFEQSFDFTFEYEPTDQNSLQELLIRVVTMFKGISETSDGVSSVCDIGIIRFMHEGVEKLKGTVDVSRSENYSFTLKRTHLIPIGPG